MAFAVSSAKTCFRARVYRPSINKFWRAPCQLSISLYAIFSRSIILSLSRYEIGPVERPDCLCVVRAIGRPFETTSSAWGSPTASK
jgi:hypothetical protein